MVDRCESLRSAVLTVLEGTVGLDTYCPALLSPRGGAGCGAPAAQVRVRVTPASLGAEWPRGLKLQHVQRLVPTSGFSVLSCFSAFG